MTRGGAFLISSYAHICAHRSQDLSLLGRVSSKAHSCRCSQPSQLTMASCAQRAIWALLLLAAQGYLQAAAQVGAKPPAPSHKSVVTLELADNFKLPSAYAGNQV